MPRDAGRGPWIPTDRFDDVWDDDEGRVSFAFLDRKLAYLNSYSGRTIPVPGQQRRVRKFNVNCLITSLAGAVMGDEDNLFPPFPTGPYSCDDLVDMAWLSPRMVYNCARILVADGWLVEAKEAS